MTVYGTDRLIAKLSALPAALRKPITNALEASAAEMHGHAVIRIQKSSGGGKTYKRGKRFHTASAPGEFPNTDTGALVNSMRWEARGPFNVIWGAFISYAKFLELGTSRMAARPFIRPTFEKLLPKASERVANAINAALRSYGR
jgi:HK97 gp10 family phage protein